MEPTAPPQLESDSSLTAESTADSFPTVNRSRFAAIPSLPEAHRTIPVASSAHWLRKILAFAGPGYLVAVGYMDPGNWATDLGGGSKFGYTLLSVILISNLMAMFLQALSAKLGIATGRDLAQACREHYSRRTSLILRSEEHTSELQSLTNLVCRLLLEKKNKQQSRLKKEQQNYKTPHDTTYN